MSNDWFGIVLVMCFFGLFLLEYIFPVMLIADIVIIISVCIKYKEEKHKRKKIIKRAITVLIVFFLFSAFLYSSPIIFIHPN